MRLPENVELIVIETTVLNAVHFQNYGTHNFLHPERTCSTAHFKKKKIHTDSSYRTIFKAKHTVCQD
jgi:hypothetical protein